MLGTIGSGWVCPKCNTVVSPYETTCPKCIPPLKAVVRGGTWDGTMRGYAGTITLGPVSWSGLSGTFYDAPPKTDAQKLEEAQTALDTANRKLKKYSEWADKIITFYGQLNELTQDLDDLTDEPDEIEND